jgi:hypothetical protein
MAMMQTPRDEMEGMIAAQMHRAEDLVDGHTVLLLDRLNRITSR